MQIKQLKALAREYFYAENWVDLEDTMLRLRSQSEKAAADLRVEFEDSIMENHLLDEVGGIGEVAAW